MRLVKAQVTNYKSILDSGPVEINPSVTCLMGMNEAGKSAFMQALWKFRNVAEVGFDRLFDLPAKLFTELRKQDPKVVDLTFVLEDSDKLAIKEAFPDLPKVPTQVRVDATYDDERTYDFGFEYPDLAIKELSKDLGKLISELADVGSKLADGPEKTQIGAAQVKLEKLKEEGSSKKAPNESIKAAITALNAVTQAVVQPQCKEMTGKLQPFMEAEASRKKLEKWVWERLPNFIYFDDYGRLKTRINLPDFNAKKGKDSIHSDEKKQIRSQVALFEWAKLDSAELLKLGIAKQQDESQEAVDRRKDERRKLLESASFSVSGDWEKWWDGSEHRLNLGADGDDLTLHVSDNVNPWKIPFSERSRGFQWFFSFYLTFLVESRKAHQGSILLLDEPGLHLHLARQLKLLKFFQELSKRNQIVYSSHSPFMVDPDHVDNIRTVYTQPLTEEEPDSKSGTKGPKKEKSKKGGKVKRTGKEKKTLPEYTKVSPTSEPEGDRDTLLPLQYAGAYLLAQTVFIGKRTLIVEGISDYWLLRALSTFAQENGGGELHKDTVVLWAGGTSRILTLASVMVAREQVGPNRMAVLLDSDKAGTDQAKRLIEDILIHGSESLLLIGDVLSIPRAQVEDLAEPDELMVALHKIGRNPKGKPSRATDETNVEFLKRLFKENGWGELDKEEKARLALALSDDWRSGKVKPDAATVERAKKVFSAINTCFEKLLSMSD